MLNRSEKTANFSSALANFFLKKSQQQAAENNGRLFSAFD